MTRPADEAARTVTLTRLFRAPRSLVFRAWTRPEHVGRWWGPEGFTVTTLTMNVSPGGRWRYVMHGPDGAAYPNEIVYQEVSEPERLVYVHGDGTESFHVTVSFEAQGDETQVTMTMLFPTLEARNKAVEEVRAVEGGHETLRKLERFLRSEGGSL